MSYAVFSDSSANLPKSLLDGLEIRIVSFSYEMDGVLTHCVEDLNDFDCHGFYEKLRNRSKVKTSLLSPEAFCEAFRPSLAAGKDVVYTGLSSGVSGTVQSARIAAGILAEEFPASRVYVLDSKGAGLGQGLLACRSADLRNQGLSAAEAMPILEGERDRLCEFFTVDDLMHLRNTGRLSGATALVGTLLNIKPLLRGDEEGHIVQFGKVRGQNRAMEAFAKLYEKKAVEPEKQRVFISHGDCPEAAERLAEMVREIAEPKELYIMPHEPLTGAHVGPGMLALFFLGDNRLP